MLLYNPMKLACVEHPFIIKIFHEDSHDKLSKNI